MGADLSGQTLLHYRILEKIGEGGMGAVYRAEDGRMKRMVALKFLSAASVSDPSVHKRFVREAQAAGMLDHPNICTVFGIEETNGQAFIAMSFVDGPTLARKMREGMTLADAIDCGIGVADGCAYAHEHGVVHRDLKPANIMLSSRGLPKITDFGLARLEGRSRLTMRGTIMGTITAMAPEQLMGDDADQRADIWALGVMLYEMITGGSPFERASMDATMQAILNETPPAPHVADPRLPKELGWVFEKCLAKNRADRYQHMDELAADLRAVRKRLLPQQETIVIIRGVRRGSVAPTATLTNPQPPAPVASPAQAPAPKKNGLGWPMIAAIALVAVAIIVALVVMAR